MFLNVFSRKTESKDKDIYQTIYNAQFKNK